MTYLLKVESIHGGGHHECCGGLVGGPRRALESVILAEAYDLELLLLLLVVTVLSGEGATFEVS